MEEQTQTQAREGGVKFAVGEPVIAPAADNMGPGLSV